MSKKKRAQKARRKGLLGLEALLAVAALLALAWALGRAAEAPLTVSHPLRTDFSVLVDVGHGGFDGGAVGVGGTVEAELNLQVARQLETVLTERGIPCAMTRSSGAALGEDKAADMEKRCRIIRESPAELMVSIHMNAFPADSTVAGPQVFSQQGSVQGTQLAAAVQKQMNALGISRKNRTDDLKVLRAGKAPAILVECGFLSNPEEEKKLKDPAYQRQLAEAIADGLQQYMR